MKYLTSILFVIVLALPGCNFDVNETQFIDIDTYPEIEKNVKLVEDLIYYDPRYIADKVPSFNEATAKGIRLGYFVRSSDGKPSYRVTYSMKVPAVSINIESLKADFERFIPKLAAFHASKSKLFIDLSPRGEEWANSLFDSTAEDIMSASSGLLRESITIDQLANAINSISSEYGAPLSTSFVRAQYYEAFAGIPESVSLFYLQIFPNEKKALTRVSFHQENRNWAVMGFRVEPGA